MCVVLACDARIPAAMRKRLAGVLATRSRRVELVEVSGSASRFLGDLARISPRAVFHARVTPGGAIESAQLSGAADPVMVAALGGSLERPVTRRRRTEALRVGLAFNLKRIDSKGDDLEAEYDTAETIVALTEALGALGHEVVPLEVTPELPGLLASNRVDVVLNLAEGARGRNREAHLPSLCELLGVEHTGSDVATLSICLDKALAKRVLAGVRTPPWQLVVTGRESLEHLRYPVIVKPNCEGTSKGVDRKNVVDDADTARRIARRLIKRYQQPAIVEEYVTGREITVAVLGDRKPTVLPPMEVLFNDGSPRPVYDYTCKQRYREQVRYECPARLTRGERRAVESICLEAFAALGCRDVARIDLRLDASGRAHVLEVNPLPGLSPHDSDLWFIARAAGIEYVTLIGEVLKGALRRRAQRAQAS